MSQILIEWAVVLALSMLLANGQTVAKAQASPANEPKILASFDAVTGDPGMSYKDHPDMAMAACSNCGEAGQVLVATGQDIAVYDTSGALLKKQNMRDFIKAAGIDPDAWASRPALPPAAAGKVNDPRATYDPFIGSWIVVCSCSGDFLIVSGSKDATGPWKGVALTGSAGDLTMFPGWDRNGVYVSEFQLKLNSQVIALPGSDVAWKGEGNISLAHKAVFNDRMYEMRPAIDPNPKKKPTDPEYLVARSGPPQNCHEPSNEPARGSDHLVGPYRDRQRTDEHSHRLSLQHPASGTAAFRAARAGERVAPRFQRLGPRRPPLRCRSFGAVHVRLRHARRRRK